MRGNGERKRERKGEEGGEEIQREDKIKKKEYE